MGDLVAGPAPAGTLMWAVVLGYALGGLLMVACLWLLWSRRPGSERQSLSGRLLRLKQWRDGMTEPTRVVVSLCLGLLGYHAISYASPPAWLGLRVPPDQWWALVLGVAAVVGLSLLADRVTGDRTSDRPGHEAGDRAGK